MSAVLSGLASLGSSEVFRLIQTKQTAQPFHLPPLSLVQLRLYDLRHDEYRSILLAYERLVSASARYMNASEHYAWMQR
jgi:hypothetical protein